MSTGLFYRSRPILAIAALLGLLLPQVWPSSPLPLDTTAVSLAATAVYASPSGSDSNPGTQTAPFKTIQKAVNSVTAGGTVYVRAGTYHETVRISQSGTASQRITISAYPGEHAVIDGANTLPAGSIPNYNPLVYVTASYVTLTDLEIANSTGMGLEINGSNNIVRHVNVHNAMRNGILVSGGGANNLVENSDVWSNCMTNVNGTQSSWSTGLSAARSPVNTILRGNRVHNNWGEGLSSFEASGTIIENNIVYDNYAVNIYIDNVPYAVVQRNLVYHTGSSAFDRAPGIAFCDEDYGHPATSHDLKILNNLVLGGNRAFYFWLGRSDGGLKNSIIAYNTFADSTSETLFQINAGNHQNSYIENNIFLQEGSLPIADVTSNPELHFNNNVWSKTPPANALGSASIVANPLLAKAGSTAPGQLAAAWFALLAGSPAINRAVAISTVTTDYAGNPRGSSPDCGGLEYLGTAPNPTATPTQAPPTPTVAATPKANPAPPSAPGQDWWKCYLPFISRS